MVSVESEKPKRAARLLPVAESAFPADKNPFPADESSTDPIYSDGSTFSFGDSEILPGIRVIKLFSFVTEFIDI